MYFYALEIEDRGAYCFCPVCDKIFLLVLNVLTLTVDQLIKIDIGNTF